MIPAIPPNTGALFKAGLSTISRRFAPSLEQKDIRYKCSLAFDKVHMYSDLMLVSSYTGPE